MFFTELLHSILANLKDTSVAEVIAVITGLMSVWYAKKENILVYPVGIVSVLIYVYLCFRAGLYADMGINAFYFVMSLYGWYMWTRKNQKTKAARPISSTRNWEKIISLIATPVFAGILFFLLSHYTDSTVPFWDSLTTAIFIVSMWLMALKKIENWIGWIVGDSMCVFLFYYKGLALSSFQYLVFLGLAISGYLEWRTKLPQLKSA